MADVYCTVSRDSKPAVLSLLRRLPAIMTGKVPDEHDIGRGFRTRIGFAILSLIAPNFQTLSRGLAGADGNKWPPLSREYLAYGRRFGKGEQSALKKQHGLNKANYLAPGDKKGLLTRDQYKLWRQIFADRYAWYMMREPDAQAKAHAAAVAWIVVKSRGAKTKLEVYGNRPAQILVDTGRLRSSLQPGSLYEETGPNADYTKPSQLQVFDIDTPFQVVVGSDDEKAAWHHAAKNLRKRRRLWPEHFPQEWWQQILGVTLSGLVRIGELFNRGQV